MIKSMTGFGKAVAERNNRRATAEVRTLNSKMTDLSLKIPPQLRDREWEIRNRLTQRFQRGKIDLVITMEYIGETPAFAVNRPLAMQYYRELKELGDACGEAPEGGLLPLVVRMPDVVGSAREGSGDEGWEGAVSAMDEAIGLADGFRLAEGEVLANDLRQRVASILSLLDRIEPLEPQRISSLKERLNRDFLKFSADFSGQAPDANRFEQEIIYYLEKLDITEEKVRLRKHCHYFSETMEEAESQGKKLGFIAQEMGREINTIGAKASDAAIQRIVVEMKDELEKVKEQLGNIL